MKKQRKVKHLDYFCVGPTITPQKINSLKSKIKKEHKIKTTWEYFAILSGKTRLKILYILQKEKELCVCDIADILETTVSAVSHQLKILRITGFVKFHKKAQTIFYYLSKKSKAELKNHF